MKIFLQVLNLFYATEYCRIEKKKKNESLSKKVRTTLTEEFLFFFFLQISAFF